MNSKIHFPDVFMLLGKAMVGSVLLVLLSFSPTVAQQSNGSESAPADTTAAKQDSTAQDSTKQKEKTFSDYITDDAVSMEGMLTVHKVKDKYYFEIPDSLFGRDIMAVTREAKTPTGARYGGEQANRQVVRFKKGPEKKVLLKVITYVNVAEDTTQAIHQAVTNSNMQPIIGAFDVKAERKDTSVLIDVTDFLKKPNQAFELPPLTKQRYKIKNQINDRTFIESVRAYPINVEVRVVRTYDVNPPSLGSSSGPSVNLTAGVNAGVVTYEL